MCRTCVSVCHDAKRVSIPDQYTMQLHFMHNHAHETAGAASVESSRIELFHVFHLTSQFSEPHIKYFFVFDFEEMCAWLPVAAPRPREKYGGERC